MNRREFTRGLASLGLTPALPLPAIGAGSTATAAATTLVDKMYFVGWYTARMNKTCSPDILISELKVDGQTARAIFKKLIKNGTVTAPDALGVSQTVKPLRHMARKLTRTAVQTSRATAKTTSQKAIPSATQAGEDNLPLPHDLEEVAKQTETDQALDAVPQDALPMNADEAQSDPGVTPPTGIPQTRSVAEK